MKKVLLATTALTLSAGVAYAEVSLGGSARMGLVYADSDVELSNRIRLDVTASTETTSGISFGANMRIQSSLATAGVFNGVRVYMQTNGIEVAMGNIWGALDSMPGMYPNVGFTGLGWTGIPVSGSFDGYSSSDDGVGGVEVMYTSGAFSGHVSYSDADLGSTEDRLAAYAAYTAGDWTVAAGGQSSPVAGEDLMVLTVGGKVGDYGVGFGISDNDGDKKIALNGSATMGAATVKAIASKADGDDAAFGLGVSYDLGGASLAAGVERDSAGDTMADLGVSFSF